MHCNLHSKEGYMAVNLDMSKPYNQIKWGFLKLVMKKLGFSGKLISRTMECITFVSYSIYVNGEPLENSKPTRGLRQGESFSPYLFLLCLEDLSCLINYEGQKIVHGVPIARGVVWVSHLFLADASLLFIIANSFDWSRLQGFLELYEPASEQQLNCEKTSLETINVILDIVVIQAPSSFEQYIGVLGLIGRSQAKAFKFITDV